MTAHKEWEDRRAQRRSQVASAVPNEIKQTTAITDIRIALDAIVELLERIAMKP